MNNIVCQFCRYAPRIPVVYRVCKIQRITKICRFHWTFHITPVLHLLTTLAIPVRQRVDIQVATLVHRSLSGNSASYLADDCRLVTDVRERRLRSTESRTCVVTRTHSIFGDRTFAAAGPRLWNSLPPHLRDADLPYSRFRRSLKTFLFG